MEKTLEALADLERLLQLSQDAALRLKQHVPGDYFPIAYKLAKKLKSLEVAVEEIQRQVDPTFVHLPGSKNVVDLISSSDQL